MNILKGLLFITLFGTINVIMSFEKGKQPAVLPKEDARAIKIQALWRGYQVRKTAGLIAAEKDMIFQLFDKLIKEAPAEEVVKYIHRLRFCMFLYHPSSMFVPNDMVDCLLVAGYSLDSIAANGEKLTEDENEQIKQAARKRLKKRKPIEHDVTWTAADESEHANALQLFRASIRVSNYYQEKLEKLDAKKHAAQMKEIAEMSDTQDKNTQTD